MRIAGGGPRDGLGGIAHPQQIGEGTAVVGGGANAERPHASQAAGEGQDEIEGMALVTQGRHRFLEGVGVAVLESGEDIAEPRCRAVGEVEQNRETARAILAAPDAVPGQQSVGRRRQHLAPGLDFPLQAAVAALRLPQAPPQP